MTVELHQRQTFSHRLQRRKVVGKDNPYWLSARLEVVTNAIQFLHCWHATADRTSQADLLRGWHNRVGFWSDNLGTRAKIQYLFDGDVPVPWKNRACRGPATVTRQPSLVINQFFHHIKPLQPYDVCRHQPEPLYGPANIDGLTAAKASILSEMCKRECCHCLCLQ